VIAGLYHPLAYIAGGGLALRWFRDQFFNTRQGQALPAEEDLYARMEALAEQIPAGAEGLFFSPHLGGRVCPSAPQMRGAWLGFSWGHSQAHFYRAILESVAFEYAWYLGILKAELGDLPVLECRVAGGGARSALWNQIKANVLGVPLRRLAHSELGTWGAALLAGKASGIFEDLPAAAERSAGLEGEGVYPDPEAQQVYARLAGRYAPMQSALETYYRG
jgi:xylulokinase